jgi:hypothetical protein
MRNAWKGLVIGALTGIVAGLVLDLISGGSRKAGQLGREVKEQAPRAADLLVAAAGRGAERLHEANLPDLVRQAAHHVAEADSAEHAKEAVAGAALTVASKTKDLAESLKGSDVAAPARKTAAPARKTAAPARKTAAPARKTTAPAQKAVRKSPAGSKS